MPATMEAADAKPAVSRAMWVALVVVALSRAVIQQRTHWEYDEYLFHMGVESFDPLRHHPHPPGYPLLIGLGQLFNVFTHDPLAALLALSFVSAVIGFLALMLAFRGIVRDEAIAIGGALLYFFSPAMLVHSVEPMSDPPALMFLAIALWAATRRDEGSGWIALFALACAASIGCRPQLAVAVVPMFLLVIALARSWKATGFTIAVFAAACLAWLIPLISATGGVDGFLRFLGSQAAYVSAHDAYLSRGTRSWIEIVIRFVAHPWGPKGLSAIVLLLAATGVVEDVRRQVWRLALPLALMASIHLVFTIVTMDPADGVRYSLPAHMATSLLIALGLAAISRLPMGRYAAVAFAGGIIIVSWIYAAPVFEPRASGPSPPVAAAEWARGQLGRDAMLLWDTQLRAHAEVEFAGRHTAPVERALAGYYDKPGVPLFIYADGLSHVEGSRVFSWPESDAYGKLTRDRYRVVSVIPLTPDRRYLPVSGVNPWERDAARPEWRWLDQQATIRMPPWTGDLCLRFALPKEVPYASTNLSISIDGAKVGSLRIERGREQEVTVPAPDRRYFDVSVGSSEVFVPAAGSRARDTRRIAVTLLDVKRVERSGATRPGIP